SPATPGHRDPTVSRRQPRDFDPGPQARHYRLVAVLCPRRLQGRLYHDVPPRASSTPPMGFVAPSAQRLSVADAPILATQRRGDGLWQAPDTAAASRHAHHSACESRGHPQPLRWGLDLLGPAPPPLCRPSTPAPATPEETRRKMGMVSPVLSRGGSARSPSKGSGPHALPGYHPYAASPPLS